MMALLGFLTFTLFLNVAGSVEVVEDRITADLLQAYNKRSYPGTVDDPVVKVNYSLTLIRIKSFENNLLSFDVWPVLSWTDPRFMWSSSESTVQNIHLDPSDIWIPDIVLYNDPLPQPAYIPKVVINSQGLVTYVPPTRFQTDDCKENGSGVIRCRFKVGSWTYSGSQVDLELSRPNINMEDFKRNEDYEVVGSKAKRKVITYSCCPTPYVSLHYTIKLKRRQ